MSLPLDKTDAVALLTELARRDADVESVTAAIGVNIPKAPEVIPRSVARPVRTSADPWRNNGA